jgi:phage-related protein
VLAIFSMRGYHMEKILLVAGALLSAFLMVSVVTAVPQSHSTTVMNVIEDIEQERNILQDRLSNIGVLDPQFGGIIDLLKQLIWLIIQAILDLIEIVRNLIGLVALIDYLIQLVMILVEAIMALIEIIMNIFNPSHALG